MSVVGLLVIKPMSQMGQKPTCAMDFRRSAFASATDMKIARQRLWKKSANDGLPGSIQPL
jgi:hypothetical protein